MRDGDQLSDLPRAELEHRARALATMLRLADIVATAEGLPEVAERAVHAVQAYTDCPGIVLFRYDRTHRVFEMVAQRGFDVSRYERGTRLPAEGSLTGIAAARREVVTTREIASDPRVEPETRAQLARDGFEEAASVPILHGGEVVGALNLIFRPGSRLGDGERRLLQAIGGNLGTVLAEHAAAERHREVEKQARRAQQLESVGVLAGGIAHDFNNLLVGILGSLDLARDAARAGDVAAVPELVEDALAAAERARLLVRQLLALSQGGAPIIEPTRELARIVRDAALFTARGWSIRCEVSAPDELGTVGIDAGQIAQVVQNLVLNALQASRPGSAVQVAIDLQVTEEPQPPLPAGSWIRIRVTDRGSGIAPEILPRIFEPFFSGRGGGTGLGLAVSDSIVRAHGGHIAVESTPGRGTTFTVLLPERPATPLAPPAPAAARFQLGGRALLMDDEPLVRSVARRMLERLGFDVEDVSEGRAAIAAAEAGRASGKGFRIAVVDATVVGGLGAWEALPALRRADPGLRIVVSSGHAPDVAPSYGATRADALLQKPFTQEQLADAIRRALPA